MYKKLSTSNFLIAFTASLFLCWATVSLSQLDKYFTLLNTALSLCVALAGIAGGLIVLRKFYLEGRRDLPLWSLAALWIVIAAAILTIHPISLRHALGAGGDREDALRVEITAILHHRPPYTARTFNGNPATPLPGALLLASPFYGISRIYAQNILWTGLLTLFAAKFFIRRATAFFFLFVFVLASPGDLDDLVVGGDFFTNVLYVVIALYAVSRSYEKASPWWVKVLSLAFLGIAISSRPVYVVTLPVILAFLLQRAGRVAAWKALLLTCGVAAAITLPLYIHDFSKLLPPHLSGRANLLLPPWMHPSMALPLAGFGIACSSFRAQMNYEKVLLFVGLAMAAMLLPPLFPAFSVPFHGYPAGTNIGVLDLEYMSPAVLPLALWLMRRYELDSVRSENNVPQESFFRLHMHRKTSEQQYSRQDKA